ncbi:MAG: hypothetical protein JNJ45_01120 [Chthonomonas sp.]|nr:hypothetical protein [Chthonomonas sp.]
MPKISRPTQILVAGALIGITYMATSEEAVPERQTRKRPTASSQTKVYADGITQADIDAKFEPLNQTPKDAFQPLVKRESRRSDFNQTVAPDVIPAGFAAGESGWTFTGIVDTNGKTEALLENKGSGASVFLGEGEKWKDLTVESIGSATLSISGPDGNMRVLRLNDGDSVLPNVSIARGNEPMNPTLSGPIGNRFEITPSNGPNRSARAEITNETR